MRLTVSEIAFATNAQEPIEAQELICSMTWDSREVRPGDLYVALPGERVDGHDFVESAVKAGAAAVLVSRPITADVPVIRVADTAAALVDLAAFWRKRLEGTVLGLTGSTGKTTTKNLVRDVLAAHGSVVATIANQNNELGVPRTLLAADANTTSVVVEMGMRGTGQITELCAYAQPDWGLITNVGESHIELLGSRLNIAHAKAELLEALPDGRGIAFVNAADDYAAEVVKHAQLKERGVHAVFFEGTGTLEDADNLGDFAKDAPVVYARDVRLDGEGCPSFTMVVKNFAALGLPEADGECACTMALRGMHNVSNACSAAAVGLASGMTLQQCVDALAAAQPERGRQQVFHTADGVTVVDDSYNANPDSMRASLATFSSMDVEGRRIAVLGDMLELGDFAPECHERVGIMAAQANLDVLVCVGELSKSMARAAQEAGMDADAIYTVPDALAALDWLRPVVKPGDAVLAKASHSIGLERVAEGLVS